jgi:fibronectin-binding autotransporter adhesin
LRVDGTLNTEYVDVFGGRVQGTGNIISAADFFANFAGTVAPGNSIGTLTVTGNYVQGGAGLLEIEVTNGSADLLAVTGSAQLGGTLVVKQFGAAPLDGQVYTILTASSVTGTFASVQEQLPGLLTLRPVVYGANFVRIEIDALSFASLADGPVQEPVAAALDALGSTPGMVAAINQLQLIDPTLIPAALESLNPTRAHAQAMVGLQTGDLLRNQFGRRSHDLLGGSMATNMAQRDLAGSQLASFAPTPDMLASAALAALEGEAAGGGSDIELPNGHAIFFAADIGIAETDQAGAIGTDKADVAALTAGLDHSNGNFAIGGALSYLQSNVSQNYGLGGDTSSEGLAASGYASLHRSLFYADGFLSYAWHDFETERNVMTGPFTTVATASGQTDASQTQAGVTLGYGLNKQAHASFGVVGGLYYISMDIDGYTETGAGPLSAVLPSRSIDSLKTQLGGELAFRLNPENESLVPILRLVWNHEFEDDPLLISSGFAGAPATTFSTPGPDLGSDWATVGFGLSGKVSNGTSFYLRYQHDFGRDGQENQEVSAAARMAF